MTFQLKPQGVSLDARVCMPNAVLDIPFVGRLQVVVASWSRVADRTLYVEVT